MPIENFEGDTFVAFLDLSGFKELLKSEQRALKALDCLYRSAYSVLESQSCIEGIFISDCGILFHRPRDEMSHMESLQGLLDAVREINKNVLVEDLMLTTSIAYGRFHYQSRLEFQGIEKNALMGNAYLKAYLDNEKSSPKLKPGFCRICSEGLSSDLLDSIESIPLIQKEGRHYYYYWMRERDEEIISFKNEYNDSYNLQFKAMISALKPPRN